MSFPPYTLPHDSLWQQLMTLLWPLQCKASDSRQRVSEQLSKYLLCDTEYRRRYHVTSFLPLDKTICYSARRDAMDFRFISCQILSLWATPGLTRLPAEQSSVLTENDHKPGSGSGCRWSCLRWTSAPDAAFSTVWKNSVISDSIADSSPRCLPVN